MNNTMTTMYIIPMIIGGVFMLISWVVSNTLKRKFDKYSRLHLANGMTGREVAERMLRDNGITDVKVISTPGRLTDHYNPSNKTVNLSEAVYNQANAAAAAVAAHECGHAVQHATAYGALTFRSKMVPFLNISGTIMNIVVMASIVGGAALFSVFPTTLVFGIIVATQAVITLFSVVTLPVEFDASKRALEWINQNGIVTVDEYDGAKDALWWAAMTYVSQAMASLAMFLFFLLRFLGND